MKRGTHRLKHRTYNRCPNLLGVVIAAVAVFSQSSAFGQDSNRTVQVRVVADKSTGDFKASRKIVSGPLLGVYRSEDFGKSWRLFSQLKAKQKALDEPAMTRAKDGSLVMIARPEGEIAYSTDEGKNWSPPQLTGIAMDAPCLLTLTDGTIVCIFGWGATGGIQIMWSDDHGRTWTTPAKDRGFKIDDSAHAYAIGCEMPDGSIYLVYYDPRGDQTKTAILSLRVRIRQDRQGIEILAP